MTVPNLLEEFLRRAKLGLEGSGPTRKPKSGFSGPVTGSSRGLPGRPQGGHPPSQAGCTVCALKFPGQRPVRTQALVRVCTQPRCPHPWVSLFEDLDLPQALAGSWGGSSQLFCPP